MRQDLPQTCLSHVYESCSRSANSRKSIVLFWSPDCGYCQAMLNDLKAWEADPTNATPKLLVVSSGTIGVGGKIKVMVSDGFNSAEDISDNPFTIGNKPPVAAIISPPPGAAFTIGPKVVLEGAGMDLENGSLGDSALSWVSSIDGALGTGQLLEVNLSPGVHTITLTATDSGGLTSTASIQVTVVAQTTSINKLFLPLVIK